MLTRLAFRINTQLERYFPEQRLFLKSDHGTRFVRLRPATQAIALVVGFVIDRIAAALDEMENMTGLRDRKSVV